MAAAAPQGKGYSGRCLGVGPRTHEHPAAPDGDLDVRLQPLVRGHLDIGNEVAEPIDMNDFPFDPIFLPEARRGSGLDPIGDDGSKILERHPQ